MCAQRPSDVSRLCQTTCLQFCQRVRDTPALFEHVHNTTRLATCCQPHIAKHRPVSQTACPPRDGSAHVH
eukprot:3603814-Karenia_brevis.AAC.1